MTALVLSLLSIFFFTGGFRAVIGIIVIVIAIFVAPKVSEMLGLGTHQYLSPQNIFNTIKVLMNQIFWGSNDTYFDGSSNNALPDGFSDL